MNTFSLTGPIAESLGWTLIHHLWQGTLLAIIAACALRLMRNQSANARYLLTCMFLGLMVGFPVATAFRVYDDTAAWQRLTTVGANRQPNSLVARQVARTAPERRATVLPSIPLGSRLRAVARPMLPSVVFTWFLGVIVLSTRLVIGWRRARQLSSSGSPVPADWESRLERIAASLRIHRAIRLLQSSRIDVPMVIGWLRPVVLVPASALTGLSANQLETIFAHELAHIRRNDYLINLMQTFAETLFFYHPAVWWISHRIRIERENCCDDLAVAVCGNPVLYARALATLEGLRVDPRAVAANGGTLRERVLRVISAATPTRCSYRWVAGVSIFALIATVVIAAPLSLLANRPPEVKKPAASTAKRVVRQVAPIPMDAPETPELFGPLYQIDSEEIPATSPVESFEAILSAEDIQISAPAVVATDGNSQLRIELTPELREHLLPVIRVATLFPGEEKPQAKAEKPERTPRPDRTRKQRWDGDLTVDQLIALRSAGVDGTFIRELRELGYGELSFEDLLALRQQGVSPEFIGEMNRIGLGMLTSEDLVALLTAGVTPEYAEEMISAGIKERDVASLVLARQNGVEPAFLEALREAGLESLAMSDVIRLRQSGVDADFLRELKSVRRKKDVS
jgi:bla regulator protein blaR1